MTAIRPHTNAVLNRNDRAAKPMNCGNIAVPDDMGFRDDPGICFAAARLAGKRRKVEARYARLFDLL
jgi:hypothetical protein